MLVVCWLATTSATRCGDQPGSVATAGVLLIRKGRFVIELRAEDPDHGDKGLTLAEAQALLVPAGQQVLKNFGDQK